MKQVLLTITLFISFSYSQKYKVSFFGIHAMDIEMIMTDSTIHFDTQTVGIFDLLWPTSNTYSTSFDQTSFGVRSYEKSVRQGSYKYSVSAKYDLQDSLLIIDGDPLERVHDVQSIFTMITRLQHQNVEELDTKWFSLDHEGILCKTRLLWADTATITINDQTIINDHYRLDIKVMDDVTSIPDRSDYFMKNIIQPNIVRQIWVEKNERKRIIQASVKIRGINVIARIKNV